MYQSIIRPLLLIVLLFTGLSTKAQIVSEQNIEMKDKSIQLEGGNITFQGDNNSIYTHYVDQEGNYWLFNGKGFEITKGTGHFRLHGGDLELHDTSDIVSDPDELSSDVTIKSNDDLIIHLDDNVMEGHNELGSIQVLTGNGNEVFNLSESGLLKLRQSFNVGWSGFCNGVANGELGIILTEFNNNKVNMYASGGDLTFAFDGKNMAYISDQSGKLFSAESCTSMSARPTKSQKEFSVLENVNSITIWRDNDKSTPSDLRINVSEIEKYFPQSVEYKNGNPAIAHGDFGLIALKAIQEQQELINQLQREIKELKSN